MKKNIILDKSHVFGVHIVKFMESLNKKREYVLAKQLLRSGTNIGANIREAQAGYSKADFIYKLTISLKEARETQYWLELLRDANISPDSELKQLFKELREIIALLTAIIKTSKIS